MKKEKSNSSWLFYMAQVLLPILKNIFSVSVEIKRNINSTMTNKYKVIRIFGIKISFSQRPIIGNNNKIFIIENGIKREIKNRENVGFCSIEGDNNCVMLSHNLLQAKNNIKIRISGNDNEVVIGDSKHIINCTISLQDNMNNRKVHIGKDFSSGGTGIECLGNGKSVTIGNDCMFSIDVTIWNSDYHAISDIKTGELLNNEKDVIICNHVWVGMGVSILKGSIIPDGCVVGKKSVVTKCFEEENAILVGTPAKVVKRDILWHRINAAQYLENINDESKMEALML